MKFNALIAQLANRINQPRVIETYLRLVFDKGRIYGREIAEERHAKALQELKDKAVKMYKNSCPRLKFGKCDNTPYNCDSICKYIEDFTKKLNEK